MDNKGECVHFQPVLFAHILNLHQRMKVCLFLEEYQKSLQLILSLSSPLLMTGSRHNSSIMNNQMESKNPDL